MKQVFFEKLWLENFCNHQDRIEVDLTDGKLVLITGPNGSGKTSMLQAIPFALYGQCEKGRGEDVLNDKAMKNCCAGVSFRIGQHVYTVERFIKYTKVGTTVVLKQNGIVMCQGHKEVVPEIERILIPREGFNNTLMFSQKVKTFFTDLKDSEQKKIFRKVLNLDNYTLYGEETTKRIKNIGIKVLELNRQLEVNKGIQNENELIVTKLEAEQLKFDTNKKKSIVEFESIIKTLTERKDYIETMHEEHSIAKYDTQLTKVTGRIGFLSSKLNNVRESLEPKMQTIEDHGKLKKVEMEKAANELVQKAKDKAELEVKELSEKVQKNKNKILNSIEENDNERKSIEISIASLTANLSNVIDNIQELELDLSSLQDPVCPTCKQPIDEEILQQLTNKLNQLKEVHKKEKVKQNEFCQELSEKDYDKGKLKLELDGINSDENLVLNDIQSKFNETNTTVLTRLKTANDKIEAGLVTHKQTLKEDLEEETVELLRELNACKAQKGSFEEKIKIMTELRKELNDLSLRLVKVTEGLKKENEKTFDDTQLNDLVKKCDELRLQVKSLISERTKYTKTVEILEFWKEGFSNSGIQSLLIDESIPFMNRRIAEYMDKLCNGRYTVTFDTLQATKAGEFRDRVQVNVFDNVTHADNRVKFSGGQKRMVDIGAILTLHDLQSQVQDVEFNILLFDEIFDSLDETNTEYTAKLIRQVSKNKWTGVISHTKLDQIEADEVLSFS